MFQNYKTIKVTCPDQNGFELSMRVKLSKNVRVFRDNQKKAIRILETLINNNAKSKIIICKYSFLNNYEEDQNIVRLLNKSSKWHRIGEKVII